MREILLEGRDLLKIYGPTTAVNHLDIDIYSGEVLSLVGGNGAGKSTLIKLLSGVVKADGGSLRICGQDMDLEHYSPAHARREGIRVVHQELSLCRNLTVYENFYIEQHEAFEGKSGGWRKIARQMAQKALDTVFPGHGIDVGANLAKLSIAQQQMVEIARATSDHTTKLLILDEPTSSLPARETQQFMDYIKKSAKEQGVAYIYISHRFSEILFLSDYVYIMQNGSRKHYCPIGETSVDDMIERMGQKAVEAEAACFTAPEQNPSISVVFDHYSKGPLRDITCSMYGGEIITLTGLEGNGQLEHNSRLYLQAKFSGL